MSEKTMSEATTELPLFPLNTVLFPRGPLPLRIFETRYTDMVKRCMRESSCFGVVLVRGGREVGDTSGFETIGTSARIVDFNLLEDGLLGISCRGERRFRVVRTWRQADGLNVGEVQWLDLPQSAVPPVQTVPAQYLHLADLLRRVLPELGEFYAGLEPRFEDADWVANRLLEILPISAGEKQRCLELDDPLERLALVSPLIRRAEDPEGD